MSTINSKKVLCYLCDMPRYPWAILTVKEIGREILEFSYTLIQSFRNSLSQCVGVA